jgi:hypothetical protein
MRVGQTTAKAAREIKQVPTSVVSLLSARINEDKNVRLATFRTTDNTCLLSRIALFLEAALALVQKLDGRKKLTDLLLHIIITNRGQLYLLWELTAMRLKRQKSTVKSAYKQWATFHRFRGQRSRPTKVPDTLN